MEISWRLSDREIEDVDDQRLWYTKIQDKHLSHLYVDSWKKNGNFNVRSKQNKPAKYMATMFY